MNQIGSKNIPVVSVEKENFPPTTPSSPPDWAIAAKNDLLGTDLGAEWRECVQGWIELEEALGYGSITRSRVRTYYTIHFSKF
jgi:hypothetical protein